METKELNIEIVNAWLKEQYGMSYDELSKEFNKVVDLLGESLKQRKEMRNKINKISEYVDKMYDVIHYKDYPPYLDEIFYTLHPEAKEDK